MSEKELTRLVIQLARLLKWRSAHFRPAMLRSGKWVTPVQGDGKGFPDLVLVRPPRLLFVELKVGKNRMTPEQVAWMTDLAELPGVECYVWRPDDLKHFIPSVLSLDKSAPIPFGISVDTPVSNN